MTPTEESGTPTDKSVTPTGVSGTPTEEKMTPTDKKMTPTGVEVMPPMVEVMPPVVYVTPPVIEIVFPVVNIYLPEKNGAPPDENVWPFSRFTVFTKHGEPPQRNIFPNYVDVLLPFNAVSKNIIVYYRNVSFSTINRIENVINTTFPQDRNIKNGGYQKISDSFVVRKRGAGNHRASGRQGIPYKLISLQAYKRSRIHDICERKSYRFNTIR